jgi:dCMP deaminase
MTSERPSWDEYFFSLALVASTRATCPRKRVGAVIVDRTTHRVLSTGYNGAPRGLKHCTEIGCALMPCPAHESHCMRAVHAERNAIQELVRLVPYYPMDRLVLYATHEPCLWCSRLLEWHGLTTWRWLNDGDRRRPCSLVDMCELSPEDTGRAGMGTE